MVHFRYKHFKMWPFLHIFICIWSQYTKFKSATSHGQCLTRKWYDRKTFQLNANCPLMDWSWTSLNMAWGCVRPCTVRSKLRKFKHVWRVSVCFINYSIIIVVNIFHHKNGHIKNGQGWGFLLSQGVPRSGHPCE